MALLWKLYLATPLGISLYAAGENPVGAYRAGVPVDAARIAAYALSGLLSTLAGLFIAAQTGSGDPVIGTGLHAQFDRRRGARRCRLPRRRAAPCAARSPAACC